jgi:hypothetical protein
MSELTRRKGKEKAKSDTDFELDDLSFNATMATMEVDSFVGQEFGGNLPAGYGYGQVETEGPEPADTYQLLQDNPDAAPRQSLLPSYYRAAEAALGVPSSTRIDQPSSSGSTSTALTVPLAPSRELAQPLDRSVLDDPFFANPDARVTGTLPGTTPAKLQDAFNDIRDRTADRGVYNPAQQLIRNLHHRDPRVWQAARLIAAADVENYDAHIERLQNAVELYEAHTDPGHSLYDPAVASDEDMAKTIRDYRIELQAVLPRDRDRANEIAGLLSKADIAMSRSRLNQYDRQIEGHDRRGRRTARPSSGRPSYAQVVRGAQGLTQQQLSVSILAALSNFTFF